MSRVGSGEEEVEKDEKDGDCWNGEEGWMPRRGGEGPRVHFAYNLLALDIPEVMLYRSCCRPSSPRSSLSLLPVIPLTILHTTIE